MSEQTNDAAERSAHVTRGAAAQDSASVVREWREDGKLVACAEGVARMREERDAALARVAELEEGLREIATDLRAALAAAEGPTSAAIIKEIKPHA